MKTIFLLIDGLSDEIYNNKTPLSEAKKPNIDDLLKKSFVSKLRIFDKWDSSLEKSASHKALLKIFGYEIEVGRGLLEAIGNNMSFENGNLALRGNFSTVENNIVKDRRASRNIFRLDELLKEVNENLKNKFLFEIKRGYVHRIALVLKGEHSKNIETNDVNVGEKIKRILPLDSSSVKTAKILQDFIDKSSEILSKSEHNREREKIGLEKANYLMLRDPENKMPKMKKHFNKKCLAIVENGAVKGCCILAGFDILNVPEIIDNKYKIDEEKTIDFIFSKIIENLEKYKLIFAHIKSTDVAAHDKNFDLKKSYIEKIDDWIGELKEKNIKIVITTDHSTSCITGKHVFGEVPLLIYNVKNPSKIKRFDEIEIQKQKSITPKILFKKIGWKLG